MIELTWKQINNESFRLVIQGLVKEKLEFKTSLKVLNIVKKVQEELKRSSDMIEILRGRYMDFNKEKKIYEVKPGMEVDAEKADRDWSENKFRIDIPKIKYSEISFCSFSPLELMTLEDLLENDLQANKLKLVPTNPEAPQPSAPA